MPSTSLRLITVPDTAPPYDCEAHGAACPAGRDTAQRDTAQPDTAGRDTGRVDPLGTGQPPEPPPPARSASPAGSASPANALAPDRLGPDRLGPDRLGPDRLGPDRLGPDRLGPDRLGPAWPLQFAQVVVEILAGARSPRQIVPCTTDRVRAQIGELMPLLASDHRPRIRRILTSRPTARAVEMSVVVSFGPRSRALAIRCEHLPARPAAPGLPARPARWLCTELIAG
jgi:hypothetical protein